MADTVDNSYGKSDTEEDAIYEKFNMAEHEPLNDPNCKHKNVVKDDTEELGDAYFCPDCRIGWILTPADSPS